MIKWSCRRLTDRAVCAILRMSPLYLSQGDLPMRACSTVLCACLHFHTPLSSVVEVCMMHVRGSIPLRRFLFIRKQPCLMHLCMIVLNVTMNAMQKRIRRYQKHGWLHAISKMRMMTAKPIYCRQDGTHPMDDSTLNLSETSQASPIEKQQAFNPTFTTLVRLCNGNWMPVSN